MNPFSTNLHIRVHCITVLHCVHFIFLQRFIIQCHADGHVCLEGFQNHIHIRFHHRFHGFIFISPIICVGESLEQREMGVTMELIALQVKSALAGVAAENIRRCVIAYEPIWAIGTGKTATGEQAAEVCGFIRATIRAMYGARIARSVTIQYGGSMNPANAAELLGHEDIDGGLIGGASLDAGKFMDIVNAANQG